MKKLRVYGILWSQPKSNIAACLHVFWVAAALSLRNEVELLNFTAC